MGQLKVNRLSVKQWLLLSFVCLYASCLCGQRPERIMFYNVENLFDTYDNPETKDDEFTPWGEKHWTRDRYRVKLQKLADAVKGVGEGSWPLVVGLAEVENRRVLEDFIEKTILADAQYGIVHRDSPDARGIDVALLYRQPEMQLLDSAFLRVPFPEDKSIRTRDVLYAKMLHQTDTLHFFVCHFPSMIGGEKQSEWKRMRAASVVRHKVDSLFSQNPDVLILMMGDLNGKADTPTQKVLGTQSSDKKIQAGKLYNTGYYLLKKQEGTYRYQGRWQAIDHIIVSGGFINGVAGCSVERRSAVFSAGFLLEEDKKHYGYRPFPTYRGPRYYGGTSDHLPIYIQLKSKRK